jgi:hypothetical protein
MTRRTVSRPLGYDGRIESLAKWEANEEACLEKAKASQEKTDASLEEMEAAADIFEESQDKMVTMNLEASPE